MDLLPIKHTVSALRAMIVTDGVLPQQLYLCQPSQVDDVLGHDHH